MFPLSFMILRKSPNKLMPVMYLFVKSGQLAAGSKYLVEDGIPNQFLYDDTYHGHQIKQGIREQTFVLKSNNHPEDFNLPASMNPCFMLSLEQAAIAISGRTERKSTNAFYFVSFNNKNFIFSNLNMLLTIFFIRYLSDGMSLTVIVCIFWIFLIILNTQARSAGCSTPDCAAFSLLAIILFSM